MLDTLAFASAAIAVGNANTHLREDHRMFMVPLQHEMEAAAAGSSTRQHAALRLCRLRGVVGEGDAALESVNELGETPLLQAVADGQLINVRLLLAAGSCALLRAPCPFSCLVGVGGLDGAERPRM